MHVKRRYMSVHNFYMYISTVLITAYLYLMRLDLDQLSTILRIIYTIFENCVV